MPKCQVCNAEYDQDDEYEYAGKLVCEDCYLDAVSKPKTCDPWATYSATRTDGQDAPLTENQQRILDLLTEKGALPKAAIRAKLDLSEDELDREFATLRHMERARGCKVGEQVCLTLFDDPAH